MKVPNCQAKNKALCVDPQCPEKRFHVAETGIANLEVSRIQNRLQSAQTLQDFTTLNDELQVAIWDADATRGGIESLRAQYDSLDDNLEKDLIFARLEMAKERFEKKYSSKTDVVEQTDGQLVKNGLSLAVLNELISSGQGRETLEGLGLLTPKLDTNNLNFLKDSMNAPHNYTVLAPKIISNENSQYTIGAKSSEIYEAISQITKNVRADIKDAISKGYLPDGLKYSVAQHTSGGNTFNVIIRGLNDNQIYSWKNADGNARTLEAKELQKRVENIISPYNRTTEFYGTSSYNRFYAYARIEDEAAKAMRSSRNNR